MKAIAMKKGRAMKAMKKGITIKKGRAMKAMKKGMKAVPKATAAKAGAAAPVVQTATSDQLMQQIEMQQEEIDDLRHYVKQLEQELGI